jgi:hypothetical protein
MKSRKVRTAKIAANVDDEYTPEQRRIIDGELALGLEDFKQGRFHGPFTAEEFIRHIEQMVKERAAAKKARRRALRSVGIPKVTVQPK